VQKGEKPMTDKKPMARWKKITIATSLLSLFTVAGFIPYTSQLRDSDRRDVVSHATQALRNGNKVWLSSSQDGLKHRPLYDANNLKDRKVFYFRNGLGINDDIFLRQELQPIPKDRKPNINKGDVIIGFSNKDMEGKPIADIHFYYVFGDMGAQGYEIKVRRSLFCRYLVYTHCWVS
jgi:hypothetical protein